MGELELRIIFWVFSFFYRLVLMVFSLSMKMMDGVFFLVRVKAFRISLVLLSMNICISWGLVSFRKVVWGREDGK